MDGERYYARWEGGGWCCVIVIGGVERSSGSAVSLRPLDSVQGDIPASSTHTMMVGRSGGGSHSTCKPSRFPPGYALSVEEQKGSSICLS